MTLRGAVTGCLVVVCVVAMLAERAEGHFTFFSPKEMREMKEKDERKDAEPRSEDGLQEETPAPTSQWKERRDSPGQPVQIGVTLTTKQMDDMLQKILDEAEKDE